MDARDKPGHDERGGHKGHPGRQKPLDDVVQGSEITTDPGKPETSADGRLHDLVGIAHGLAALDLVDVLHAGDDLAPRGVLLVKETRVVEADEELRIGAVGARRAFP